MTGMEEPLRSDDRLPVPPAEKGSTASSPGGDRHRLTFTLRYLLGIGFRHQGLVVVSFALIFAAVFVFVLLRPPQVPRRG